MLSHSDGVAIDESAVSSSPDQASLDSLIQWLLGYLGEQAATICRQREMIEQALL